MICKLSIVNVDTLASFKIRNNNAMALVLLMAVLTVSILPACGQRNNPQQQATEVIQQENRNDKKGEDVEILNPGGQVLQTRIIPPAGFQRISCHENSFAAYLRQLPLKPHGAKVHYYNGGIKPDKNIYEAVADLEIGDKDLHQCADAVMRLRAEYLWDQKQYDRIHFNFTNGFRVDYSEWIKGKRIAVNGNTTRWVKRKEPSNTYDDLWNYLEVIFTYAGTLSLSKELKTVDFSNIKTGDVFIQGGSPGHAVIVVDMAQNPTSGEKLFLLAQSYMPAQDIQILKNPNNKTISPWYSSNFDHKLITPEWTFTKADLKRFEE